MEIGFVFGFIILIVILIVVASISAAKAAKERQKNFQEMAEKISFNFIPFADESLLERFKNFELFNRGHSKTAFNLLEGQSESLNWKIFDYKYTTGSGKHRTTHSQTVFCAYLEDYFLPKFSLAPEYFFHKWGNVFGFDDIDFPDFKEFSDKYLLNGPNEQEIRTLFKPKIIKYFEGRSNVLNMEADNYGVLMYSVDDSTGSNFVKPENIPGRMKEYAQVIQVFRESVMSV